VLLQVYGTDPSSWLTQYQEVIQAENGEGQKHQRNGK